MNADTQAILDKLVSREIHCNVNSLIQTIQAKDDSFEFWEEWENMYYKSCTECGCRLTDAGLCTGCDKIIEHAEHLHQITGADLWICLALSESRFKRLFNL